MPSHALNNFGGFGGVLSGLSGLFSNFGQHNQVTPAPTPAATPTPAVTPVTSSGELLLNTTQDALGSAQAQGLQNFYNSAAYQFPLQEGLDAVNAQWAGRSAQQSGAAEKGVLNYAANAAAGGLNQYLSYLGNQQAVGATAASGQTGVSQNYANSMSNANANLSGALSGAASNYGNNAANLATGYANSIGNAYGNLANAQGQYATNVGNINSNAAIANANNTNGLISGLGSAAGSLAGYYAYGGFGGGGTPINPNVNSGVYY